MELTFPFLKRDLIEREADLLLHEFAIRYRRLAAPPIPIDEILELHLDLRLSIEPLQEHFASREIFGGIHFDERRVVVDQSLDPESHPKRIGRYHFTLAHEIGHWRLHRRHYFRRGAWSGEFAEESRPDRLCLESERTNPVERQANIFAGCLLMPQRLILQAWESQTGGRDPLDEEELLRRLQGGGRFGRRLPATWLSDAVQRLCREMAALFEVSTEAMRIRLEECGMLPRTTTEV